MSQTSRMDSIIDSLLTQIETVMVSPKVSYNINDQEVSWTEYTDMLFRSLEKAYELRAKLAGPVSVSTVMRAW